jgi:hypothetical protein
MSNENLFAKAGDETMSKAEQASSLVNNDVRDMSVLHEWMS